MAKEKKSESLAKGEGTLADLIGNSIAIKLPDGSSIIVPADKAGNRIANMISAANVRHLLMKSIEVYREKDMLPTPKDLKDLAEAAHTLSKFSGEVYKDEEVTLPTEPKKAADKPKQTDDVSFEEVMPEKK